MKNTDVELRNVEIKAHKCYMQWKRQKGGRCKREICVCKGNMDKYIKPIKDFNLNELKIKAKEENIEGFDKMNKQELMILLNPFPFTNEEEQKKLPKCTYTEKYIYTLIMRLSKKLEFI